MSLSPGSVRPEGTTPTAPRYLLPRFARRFRFLDMSDSVNRWVPALRRRGVEAIVVLAHSGAFQAGGPGANMFGRERGT